jgi:hypothetical protein
MSKLTDEEIINKIDRVLGLVMAGTKLGLIKSAAEASSRITSELLVIITDLQYPEDSAMKDMFASQIAQKFQDN